MWPDTDISKVKWRESAQRDREHKRLQVVGPLWVLCLGHQRGTIQRGAVQGALAKSHPMGAARSKNIYWADKYVNCTFYGFW